MNAAAIYIHITIPSPACEVVCVCERRMGNFSVLILSAALMVGVWIGVGEAQLAYDYYKRSCPNLEAIVKKEVLSIFLTDATALAAFLRLMFHDCQVQGCDASILLDSDGLKTDSEMVSSKNFGIRNRKKIQLIKETLEVECPGQVSCADIIALAAKESVALSGGPQIRIPLGRKDSTTCSHQKSDIHIPPPGITVDELFHTFVSKGMNLEESVAILGAHTLGVGHCINIVSRLYDRHPGDQMNYSFELLLKLQCPTKIPLTNLTAVPIDATPLVFDNQYYKDVLMGKALFTVDGRISRDPRTSSIVNQFAADQNYFFRVFSSAFVKLSETNVLTESKGEVRRICNQANNLYL